MAKLLTFYPTIYSYPIFNFTVHHYVFFMTREISRNINSVANTSSLSCFLSLSFSLRDSNPILLERIFSLYFFSFSINVNVLSPRVQFLFIFFFFQALHLDSFVPTLRPLITRCDLLKNVQFICCAFDVLFLCRGFSNTFLGIALIRR